MNTKTRISNWNNLLEVLNPEAVLRRGYALVRHEGKIIKAADQIAIGDAIDVEMNVFTLRANIARITENIRSNNAKDG